MKNKFYHISTYSVMRYWTILWMAVLSFSCSDFNPMDSYSRIPPDRNTDIDDGDEGDGAGGLFEKGYGTMNKPYLVMDVIQIQNMSEALVKGKMIYFQLGADIDMKSVSNWEPLNSNGDYYIYFDGNNHIIKNFTCTDKAYASFFGILAGTCKNVGFYNAHVEAATNSGAGVIGGYIGVKAPNAVEKTGQVENCYVSGKVKGKYAGGIASRMGRPYGGQICYIKNCYSTAEVISTGDECGGIVGSMYENSEVSYCYSTGVLIGANSVGGIAALPSEGAKITACVAWNWKITGPAAKSGRISGVLSQGESGHQADPVASECYAWEDMICTGFAPEDNAGSVSAGKYDGVGESVLTLQNRIANWGTPWHNVGNIDMGFPILEWQLDRGDYASYGGHDNEPEGDFASGDGTQNNPYVIANTTHIQNMSKVLIGKQTTYFVLSADIDMQGIKWTPLNGDGPYEKWIIFDGRNHVIRNLTCDSGSYPSFFGVLCGECKNVGFVDANISSTNQGIGIIAGYVGLNSGAVGFTGKIINCYTTGILKGSGAAGGIGGIFGGNGRIENCYTTATIIDQINADNGKAGGIIGRFHAGNTTSYIENCYVSGDISATKGGWVGGIVGNMDSGTLNIKNCVAWSNTLLNNSNQAKIGRIVGGHNNNVTAENCYAYDGMILKAGETIFTVSDETSPSGSSFQGVAKSANELKNTVTNWDSSLWKEGSNGYPVFKWSK